MKNFKIFRPKEFPTNVGEILKLGECLKLVEDWGNLAVSIVQSDSLCKFQNNPKTETFSFWSHFLNEEGIVWTTRTQILIQTILVLPV